MQLVYIQVAQVTLIKSLSWLVIEIEDDVIEYLHQIEPGIKGNKSLKEMHKVKIYIKTMTRLFADIITLKDLEEILSFKDITAYGEDVKKNPHIDRILDPEFEISGQAMAYVIGFVTSRANYLPTLDHVQKTIKNGLDARVFGVNQGPVIELEPLFSF